jgi:hypothetical protein
MTHKERVGNLSNNKPASSQSNCLFVAHRRAVEATALESAGYVGLFQKQVAEQIGLRNNLSPGEQ